MPNIPAIIDPPVSNLALDLFNLTQGLQNEIEGKDDTADLFSLPVHAMLGGSTMSDAQKDVIIYHLELMGVGMEVGLIRRIIFRDTPEEELKKKEKRRKAWQEYLKRLLEYNHIFTRTVYYFGYVEQKIDYLIKLKDKEIKALKAQGLKTPEGIFSGAADPNCPLARAKARRAELIDFRDNTLAEMRRTLQNENGLPSRDSGKEMKALLKEKNSEYEERISRTREKIEVFEREAAENLSTEDMA